MFSIVPFLIIIICLKSYINRLRFQPMKSITSNIYIAFRCFYIPNCTVSSSRFTSSETSRKGETRITHIERQFDTVPHEERNKKAFHAAISMFWWQYTRFISYFLAIFKERRSRQHVEFIHSALKYVKEFGVHKELDTYKALLNIFPKGKMIPQNTFQVYKVCHLV